MDRRDFLKAAAALPVAAAVPGVVESRPVFNLASLKAVIEAVRQGPQSPWYAILHPSQEQALRDIAARERWNGAYRAWRADGRPPLTCAKILDKYRPIEAWGFDVGVSEIGSIDGFRFITTEKVA